LRPIGGHVAGDAAAGSGADHRRHHGARQDRNDQSRRLDLSSSSPSLILLDLSRLLQRAGQPGPTGVDRVEHAYATHLPGRAPGRVGFVAVDRLGRLLLLPQGLTEAFVAATGVAWRDGTTEPRAMASLAARLMQQATGYRRRPGSAALFYLNVSHQHLHRGRRLQRILDLTQGRLVAFVHDLIPIEFPEYARPGHAERHRLRMSAVAGTAHAVIVNSAATRAAFAGFCRDEPRCPPIVVAHLGASALGQASAVPGRAPYFLCVGTIEPRKNHLLLLHVWRRLAERHGAATPRLVLVGRRGWENENIVDLLERAPAIREYVTEQGAATDAALAVLLHGARALLFPSFAEGFGLPVVEALAAGIPVVCSDLAVLREVGGSAPTYLDPTDGPAWLATIERLAGATPTLNFAGWTPPSWGVHFDAIMGVFDGALKADPQAASVASANVL
jgi:glycosyltransferase involved in cell wall biosynthesis